MQIYSKLHLFLQECVLHFVLSDLNTHKTKFGFKQSSLIGVVLEISILLGHYAAYSDNSFSTYRDNLSVPSSRVEGQGFLDP
jgi:hypothetical protein